MRLLQNGMKAEPAVLQGMNQLNNTLGKPVMFITLYRFFCTRNSPEFW